MRWPNRRQTLVSLVVALGLASGVAAGAYWLFAPRLRLLMAERPLGLGRSEDTKPFKDLVAVLGPTPVRPALPALGSKLPYPPVDETYLYLRHIGITKSADDNDAVWIIQIAQDHPDMAARRVAVRNSSTVFSPGWVGFGLESRVTQGYREQVAEVIARFAASTEFENRASALQAIGVGRLWRLPTLDRVYEGLQNDTDPYCQTLWKDAEWEFRRWQSAKLKGP